MRGVAALVLAMTALGASCGGSASTTTVDLTTTTTSPLAATITSPSAEEDEVLLTADLPYFERDGVTKHLDVYHPASADSLPLVVLFHPNPVFGATKDAERPLAEEIASRGAVVVVPDYGARASTADMIALAAEVEVWFNEQGPCAVWAAVAHAAEFGADPDRVVLVGDVTGVGPSQGALFSPPAEVAGCLTPASTVAVDRAILFEPDWMWLPDLWDPVLTSDPAFIERMSFWDDLEDPPATSVRLLYGELEAFNTVRELDGPYREVDWIRLRDPDGALAAAFEAAGVLEDGSMSFTDVSVIALEALTDAGWDAALIEVPGVSHSLGTEEARRIVADLVFADG